MSEEMYQILETVFNSDYNTPDPEQACIFLPSVDLLNTRNTDNKLVALVLGSLSHWRSSGRNHLVLNILNNGQSLPTGEAILATPDHLRPRLGYDLTLPALSSLTQTQILYLTAGGLSTTPYLSLQYLYSIYLTTPFFRPGGCGRAGRPGGGLLRAGGWGRGRGQWRLRLQRPGQGGTLVCAGFMS